MRRTRILSVNNQTSGVSADADAARLPREATAYTVERDKDGRATRVHPPAVTVIDEVVTGPAGACPQCGAVPNGKPLRESENASHKLYRCERCRIDFAVTA